MQMKNLTIAATGILLLAPFVFGDAPPLKTLRIGGVVEPDAQIQAALKRFVSPDDGRRDAAVADLASLADLNHPEDRMKEAGRRRLAEQAFLHFVEEKYVRQGYELYVIHRTIRSLQGLLDIGAQRFVIAAAPNLGHEDRTVRETAEWVFEMLGANVPVRDRGTGQYHFRELEEYLEHVQKLGLALEDAASRVILGMYRVDPEAALNSMTRMTRRAAKTEEQRRALPDLREERECVARVRFALSVGPGSNAAKGVRPTAQQCIEQLAGSAHWYVRLYVPYIFLQDEAFIDAQLLDRLADDHHALVRQGVGNVREALQQRESIRRKAEETYGGK